MKPYLIDIARLESEFNPNAINPISKALGWFQFLPTNVKKYNGNINTFRSNKKQQIEFAIKMMKDIKTQLIPLQTYITSSKLTPSQIMYGMWWRPQSMKNYLKTGYDDYVNTDNKTLMDILEYANGKSNS